MENLIKATTNEEILLTGIEAIDKVITGLHNGDLIVIASRPSSGKESLALNIAANTLMAKNIAVFNLESSKEHYTDILTGNMLKNGQVDNKKTSKEYILDKLYVEDTPAIIVEEIIKKSTELKHISDIKLVVIDYWQLVNCGNNLEGAIKELKAMAKELKIPVIVISQLSKDVDTRDNHIPTLDDFKASKALVDYADIIMLLYKNISADNSVNTIIAKNRYDSTIAINNK